MGHPTVVHEAEDGAAEGEEKIQIRQFGPHHQRDGRRRTVTLLEACLGQQRSGKAMGKIIRHHSLSVPQPSRYQARHRVAGPWSAGRCHSTRAWRR